MNTLALLAALPSMDKMLTLLLWVAAACLIIWGIIALVRWSGIPIPQPVWIVLTVILGIVAIIFIARFFGIAV